MTTGGFYKLLLITFIFAISIFAKVYITLDIEDLTREKKVLADSLDIVNTQIKQARFQDFQRIIDHSRVVKFAQDSLGLVKAQSPYKIIYVDKSLVNRVNKLVNSKYE